MPDTSSLYTFLPQPHASRQAFSFPANPLTLSAHPPSTNKMRVPGFTCLCNYIAVLADTVPDVVHDDVDGDGGDDDDDGDDDADDVHEGDADVDLEKTAPGGRCRRGGGSGHDGRG